MRHDTVPKGNESLTIELKKLGMEWGGTKELKEGPN